jgi:stalled ribosome alternative rescue factor ArfA
MFTKDSEFEAFLVSKFDRFKGVKMKKGDGRYHRPCS